MVAPLGMTKSFAVGATVMSGTVGVKAFAGGIDGDAEGEGEADVASIAIAEAVTTLLKTFRSQLV